MSKNASNRKGDIRRQSSGLSSSSGAIPDAGLFDEIKKLIEFAFPKLAHACDCNEWCDCEIIFYEKLQEILK